jgi:hypothetical protein
MTGGGSPSVLSSATPTGSEETFVRGCASSDAARRFEEVFRERAEVIEDLTVEAVEALLEPRSPRWESRRVRATSEVGCSALRVRSLAQLAATSGRARARRRLRWPPATRRVGGGHTAIHSRGNRVMSNTQNVAALVATYTSPVRFSSAHSAALALQLRAAAPKTMTPDQQKALELVLQRANEVGEIRKARERTSHRPFVPGVPSSRRRGRRCTPRSPR